jgi:hypothetical protein
MALELTRKQQQAVDAASGEPVPVVDPRTHRAFVLVPAERYRDGHRFPDGGELPAESQLPREVPPGIQRSKAAFLRDLPSLLRQKKRKGQWVVYHGDKRLRFSKSQAELYQMCVRRGLALTEVYVGRIAPHPPEPEEIDTGVQEFLDAPSWEPEGNSSVGQSFAL